MSSEEYRIKTEAKLEEYQAKIDVAKAKLKGASADAQIEGQKQIDNLQGKLTAAKDKASGLADDAGDKWAELAKNVDDAFEGVTSAVKDFFSKSDD